jgi:hypothetical protein
MRAHGSMRYGQHHVCVERRHGRCMHFGEGRGRGLLALGNQRTGGSFSRGIGSWERDSLQNAVFLFAAAGRALFRFENRRPRAVVRRQAPSAATR